MRDGFYFAGNGREGDFYFIEISRDGKKLLVESFEGPVTIENPELFAKQTIPLANPHHNLEFAVSRDKDNINSQEFDYGEFGLF